MKRYLLSFLIFLLFLTDYKLYVASIADLALIVLIICAILARERIYVQSRLLIIVFGIIVSLLITLVWGLSTDYFVLNDFVWSFCKLVLYLVAIIILPSYLSRQDVDITQTVRIAVYIIVLGAAFQWIVVSTKGFNSWPLYSLGSQWFGLTGFQTMTVAGTSMVRARSFFSEPAHLAIAISLGFLVYCYKQKRIKKIDHIIYILGIVLANSIVGYGILFCIYSLFFISFSTEKKAKRSVMLLLPIVLGALLIFVLNPYLRGRIINLFALKDHSGVIRVIGWVFFIKYIPFFGVGLGNSANYYFSLSIPTEELFYYGGSGEFYNIIAVSLIAMGYIGTLLFILLNIHILSKDTRTLLALFATYFGSGRLFIPAIWVFLVLYITLRKKDEKISYTIQDKELLCG